MRCLFALIGFVSVAGVCAADTLTLRDGRTIQGNYLGGSAREVRMEVGDRIQTFGVETISSLQFQGGNTSSSQTADTVAPLATAPRSFQSDAAAAGAGVELPAGTTLTVRLIDAVDSERNRMGDTFRASIDEPVVANGQVVIPRGADVVAKLVDDKQSGKLAGRTVLSLALVSVQVNGRMVDVTTRDVIEQSGSRTARSGKVIGGTAAAGAVLGGIFGGGRGAAIGAASGAAAGTGAEVMTKGQRVRIPSETRLTFTLAYAART